MKVSELERLLKSRGAYFDSHCGRHDRWKFNGNETYLPRHKAKELPKGTCQKILNDLGFK